MMSNSCEFVLYPNHPQKRFRQPCNTMLMKTVISANDRKNHLYPKNVYGLKSIKSQLETMLKRPGFKELLNKGPNHSTCNFLSDICDGEIYRNFKDNYGDLFFHDKCNIGFMLNVDWFNPFKNSEYSLGAIYIVILNIAREYRFKWENVILLGLIPDPKEPKRNINPYLKPHIKKLIRFRDGELLMEGDNPVIYKFALLCVSSDVPATKKCCGFLCHNAVKGTAFLCPALSWLDLIIISKRISPDYSFHQFHLKN